MIFLAGIYIFTFAFKWGISNTETQFKHPTKIVPNRVYVNFISMYYQDSFQSILA